MCLWATRVASFGHAESGTYGKNTSRVFGPAVTGSLGCSPAGDRASSVISRQYRPCARRATILAASRVARGRPVPLVLSPVYQRAFGECPASDRTSKRSAGYSYAYQRISFGAGLNAFARLTREVAVPSKLVATTATRPRFPQQKRWSNTATAVWAGQSDVSGGPVPP